MAAIYKAEDMHISASHARAIRGGSQKLLIDLGVPRLSSGEQDV